MTNPDKPLIKDCLECISNEIDSFSAKFNILLLYYKRNDHNVPQVHNLISKNNHD